MSFKAAAGTLVAVMIRGKAFYVRVDFATSDWKELKVSARGAVLQATVDGKAATVSVLKADANPLSGTIGFHAPGGVLEIRASEVTER